MARHAIDDTAVNNDNDGINEQDCVDFPETQRWNCDSMRCFVVCYPEAARKHWHAAGMISPGLPG
jgi:hypothetical protein